MFHYSLALQQAGCLCFCKLTLCDHGIINLSQHILLTQLNEILSEKLIFTLNSYME
jgi:hypothetical protein